MKHCVHVLWIIWGTFSAVSYAENIDQCAPPLPRFLTDPASPPASECPGDFIPPANSPSKIPLFQDTSILNIEIKGGGGRVTAGTSTLLSYENAEGRKIVVPTTVEPGGASRAFSCDYPPIKLDMKSDALAGTIFDGTKNGKFKLVRHCTGTNKGRNYKSQDQNVLEEYVAYRVLNALGFASFKVRLAKTTYRSQKGDILTEGYAFFLEGKDDLAHRYGMKAQPQMDGAKMNKEYYSIGPNNGAKLKLECHPFRVPLEMANQVLLNWDYHGWDTKNVSILEKDGKPVSMVPFDLDQSLLVDTDYRSNAGSSDQNDSRWLDNLNGMYADPAWKAKVTSEAKRILARKNAVYAEVANSPLSAESKKKFTDRFDRFFAALEKLTAAP